MCPHCQVMPVRTWDTFVSDANDFALGITYATDNGAKVIEGANGSLYHSAFAEAASQYAYDHGVVQTFSGDDLNTGDHNYPANYGHAMLIQGTVPDTVGLGEESSQWVQAQKLCGLAGQPACLGSNAPVGTFFRGANTTQYGGKSSISMEGPTGSVNTSKASGAAGLVVSAGLDHGISLRPDETRESARADRRARADRQHRRRRRRRSGRRPDAAARRAVDAALRLGARQRRRRRSAPSRAETSRPRRRSTRPTGTRR